LQAAIGLVATRHFFAFHVYRLFNRHVAVCFRHPHAYEELPDRSLAVPVLCGYQRLSIRGTSTSLHGTQALAVNLSLAVTAKRQGKDPLALFKTILLNGADTPITELYDPENLPETNSS